MTVLRILGYIWAAPAAFIAFLWAALFASGAARWHRGAWWIPCRFLPTPNQMVAITIGFVVLYDYAACVKYEGDRWLDPRIDYHERRHVVQWLVLGSVLFPLLYGVGACVARLRGDDWYARNPLETDAERYAERMTRVSP